MYIPAWFLIACLVVLVLSSEKLGYIIGTAFVIIREALSPAKKVVSQ
jgi:hypothetical protein